MEQKSPAFQEDEKQKVSAEDVLRVFSEFRISRLKFEVITDVDYGVFYATLKSAQKTGRLSPSQRELLEYVAERLRETDGLNFSVPAQTLEDFLKRFPKKEGE